MNFQPVIPQGQTRENIKQREQILKDFYAMWNAANPTKRLITLLVPEIVINRLNCAAKVQILFQSAIIQ